MKRASVWPETPEWGYGDAAERPSELTEQDLRQGYVTGNGQ